MTKSEIIKELQNALDRAREIADDDIVWNTACAYGYLESAVEDILERG